VPTGPRARSWSASLGAKWATRRPTRSSSSTGCRSRRQGRWTGPAWSAWPRRISPARQAAKSLLLGDVHMACGVRHSNRLTRYLRLCADRVPRDFTVQCRLKSPSKVWRLGLPQRRGEVDLHARRHRMQGNQNSLLLAMDAHSPDAGLAYARGCQRLNRGRGAVPHVSSFFCSITQ